MKFVDSLEKIINYLQMKKIDREIDEFLKNRKKIFLRNLIAISIYLGTIAISWFHLDTLYFAATAVFGMPILRAYLEFNNRITKDNELNIEFQKSDDFYASFYQEEMKKETENLEKDIAKMDVMYEQNREEIRDRNSKWYNNKDIVMTKLATLIEDYYQIYDIPPYNIKESEWQALFDITYKVFKEGNHLDNYSDAMTDLIKYGIVDAMINKSEFFSMQNIFGPNYALAFEHFGLTEEEITKIETEFLNCNIINFNDIATLKLKK